MEKVDAEPEEEPEEEESGDYTLFNVRHQHNHCLHRLFKVHLLLSSFLFQVSTDDTTLLDTRPSIDDQTSYSFDDWGKL